MIHSLREIDLDPVPGKTPWNSDREWQDDIFYFILVDRFHDGKERKPVRGKPFISENQLNTWCGGTLAGIKGQLNYLKNLGITALWISPVFENNPEAYHGYAIQNFLDVDKRFGSITDLKALIVEAHDLDIKVVLDVVVNHSGNNWYYRDFKDPLYNEGIQYRFGGWRFPDRPLPVELRDPKLYHRKGMICHWDNYPETTEGDFFSLKKFLNDKSWDGLELQQILTRIYCWWIKETDCDGFRIDAAKHFGAEATRRFAASIKEYCRRIGKENFFLFAEVAGDDALFNTFFHTTGKSGRLGLGSSKVNLFSKKEEKKLVVQSLDSVLDFPLHFILPKLVKGSRNLHDLEKRYQSLMEYTFGRPEIGRSLVTFLDNHDQIEGEFKERFATGLSQKQIIGGLGLLFCLPGIPCLYYGTEQAFNGSGSGDFQIREPMFALDADTCFQWEGHSVFRAINRLVAIRRQEAALRKGSVFFPEFSVDGRKLHSNTRRIFPVVFERHFGDEKILVAYNPSGNKARKVYVQRKKNRIESVENLWRASKIGLCTKKSKNGTILSFHLMPHQLVILK